MWSEMVGNHQYRTHISVFWLFLYRKINIMTTIVLASHLMEDTGITKGGEEDEHVNYNFTWNNKKKIRTIYILYIIYIYILIL